jgi:hypothetical protein
MYLDLIALNFGFCFIHVCRKVQVSLEATVPTGNTTIWLMILLVLKLTFWNKMSQKILIC